MQKVLIVEDESEYQILMRRALSSDYEIKIIGAADEIIQVAKFFEPHLIVLDINLPGIDGLSASSLLREERQTAEIPFLFVSARKNTSDIILGLSVGAEDYVPKPFDPLELKARVDVKVKKYLALQERQSQFEVGELRLNLFAQTASFAGATEEQSFSLTAREFRLLAYLAQHAGQVMSRQQILDQVWGQDALDLTDRCVDSHISAIRKKCKPIQHYLESVAEVGYRFEVKKGT